MNIRLLTMGSLLLCAALLHAQSEPKASSDDAANKEAQRQAQVALQPNAQISPTQSVQQAVAFERYKEMAAEREAQKEANAVSAENNSTKPKRTAAVAKRK
jgi:hypothetical protein